MFTLTFHFFRNKTVQKKEVFPVNAKTATIKEFFIPDFWESEDQRCFTITTQSYINCCKWCLTNVALKWTIFKSLSI